MNVVYVVVIYVKPIQQLLIAYLWYGVPQCLNPNVVLLFTIRSSKNAHSTDDTETVKGGFLLSENDLTNCLQAWN